MKINNITKYMMEKCKNCNHTKNDHGIILLDNDIWINPFDDPKYKKGCKKDNCDCKKFIKDLTII